MSVSILDVLGWRNISTSVQKVETGIPDRLPPAFKTLTEPVLGERTTYATFRGQRSTARRAEYGAPSRTRALRPVGDQTVTLLHFPEGIDLSQELYLRLRQPNDLLAQTKAQEEIARHGADHRTLFDNTRIASSTFLLGTGYCYFNEDGHILPSSSGASLTVDWGVGANNRNQLNGIIDASWATDTTNIIQHIENVGVQMRRNTGRVLKNCYYGKNVAAYLYKNATLKSYWQFNSKMYDQFAASPGRVPSGFAGLDWHYMGDTFYDDKDGTTQPIWGDDVVVFAPEVTKNSYTLYEGSMLCPALFMVGDSLQALEKTTNLVYGIGGYGLPRFDPVGFRFVYFDTFMPAWKTPLDLFIADVTP